MKIQTFIRKRYIITALAFVIIIAGASTYVYLKNKVHYQTRPLKRCTITEIVEASGTINPVNTVSVGSTVSGLIKEIYVDFNSEVKKGQLMAQIDPANFEATVQQNQAQIANAQANLAKQQNMTGKCTNATKIFMQKTLFRAATSTRWKAHTNPTLRR